MSWKTIYVKGREGFHDDVVKNLDRSGLEFMAGYTSGESIDSYELFWIPEAMDIRDFKAAIGAKTVFRYRLRFHTSLESFIQKDNEAFTEEDMNKIERMRQSDKAA